MMDKRKRGIFPCYLAGMAGRNIPDAKEYNEYIECIAIGDMGFAYGEIELVQNGQVVAINTLIQFNKESNRQASVSLQSTDLIAFIKANGLSPSVVQ